MPSVTDFIAVGCISVAIVMGGIVFAVLLTNTIDYIESRHKRSQSKPL